MKRPTWNQLNEQIVECHRCPRLIAHCRQVAETRRRAYQDQTYWGQPVPNQGRSPAPLLIVGLAPGAHGANRTGRMFTGDRSGDWLFRALHRAGFCNQPQSVDRNDGLKLKQCVITAVCHCAPPGNKPTAEEVRQCRGFLDTTFRLVRPRVVLCLGGLAWKEVMRYAAEREWLPRPLPRFGHAARVRLDRALRRGVEVVGSYHPSQQNTFTGRVTEAMLDEVMATCRQIVDAAK